MRPHRVLALLAAAIACAWLGVSTWRTAEQRRLLERTALASPPGIEHLESVQLGGAEQWILVRGVDMHAPVLLWLHGGPGDPRMPRARVTDMELVKHFLVVHWDQRGAGKSLTAGLGPGALSIERLVADVCELARLMEDRFGGRRIVLVGSSWGTDLGAYAVARCPEQFAAWVSISTDVNPRRAEQISYQFVLEQARAAGDAAAIRALESIGPPPYQSLFALARERRWLERYGGEYQDAAAQEELRQAIWASPEYSLLDLLRIPVGNMLSLHELYFENAERVDLIAQVPRIEVPVIFFQGRRDFSTPGSLVEEYFTRLEAPHGKELVWFEKSSHAVPADEPGRFAEVMVERVLPLAR